MDTRERFAHAKEKGGTPWVPPFIDQLGDSV